MRKIKYILLGLGGLLILIGVSLNQRKDYFLNGYWLDESGTLYEFRDKELYWYQDYNNLTDNYYYGKIKVTKLASLKDTFNIDAQMVYIIKMYPKYVMKDNKKEMLNSKDYLLFNISISSNGNKIYYYNLDTNKEIMRYKF